MHLYKVHIVTDRAAGDLMCPLIRETLVESSIAEPGEVTVQRKTRRESMSWLDRKLKDERFALAFAQEAFVEEVIVAVQDWMHSQEISKAELAARMGVSRANVTNMLSRKNVTLRTLARVAYVLGGEGHFAIRPKTGSVCE